jgi:predicted metal-dependent hydrolase
VNYKIIRSKRKTIALILRKDFTLEVRCPHRVSEAFLADFIQSKQKWIEKVKAQQKDMIHVPELEGEELEYLRQHTQEKVKNYLKDFPGEKPNILMIRKQSSVWGTCNNKGRISINVYAGILPESLFEYVMIHELSHLIYMNHSSDFWKLVSYYLPDWKTKRAQLKKYKIQSNS